MKKEGNWFVRHKVLSVLLAFFALAIIASAAGGDSQNTTSNSQESRDAVTSTETAQKETKKAEPSIPAEYKSALDKAKQYSDTMHMSKAGLYDQLTSEYGEKFSKQAAQYAVDNVKADWKANALAKAKTYQDEMSMSPAAIRDQLTSSHGEKFTAAEADYAIQNLNN